jgi:hypothetical protein
MERRWLADRALPYVARLKIPRTTEQNREDTEKTFGKTEPQVRLLDHETVSTRPQVWGGEWREHGAEKSFC